MGGVLLNTTFASMIQGQALFWIINCSCALVAGLFAICAYDTVVILMTSFAGSYMFVRGISLYTGGYESEILIFQQVKNG